MTESNASSQKLKRLSELEAARRKMAAKAEVAKAVADGVLPRVGTHTCQHCKEVPAQHYHHESYAREDWLNVVPLCASCHRQHHVEKRRESDPYTWRELFHIACDMGIGDCAWRKGACKAELIEAIQSAERWRPQPPQQQQHPPLHH